MDGLAPLAIKAALSGGIVAAASEFAKRSPAAGGLVASLPLVSLLAMIWLWRDSRNAEQVADFALSTAVYVIGSLPAFAGLAWLLRRGLGFWPALGAAALLWIAGYVAVSLSGRRLGLPI